MTHPIADSASQAPARAQVKTLLLTDLVDSTRVVEELGDAQAYGVAVRHDRLARDLLVRFGGREIDKTDGFLLLFDRPVDAVRFALAYHQGLAELSRQQGVSLAARVGIHLGEVYLRENRPDDVARGAKPLEVEGLAKPTAARVMSLARGGQTLLTRGAYELSRRALVGDSGHREDLRWQAHGLYAFKGVGEEVEIFEVGLEGLAPLAPPPDSDKAWRAAASPRRGGLGAFLHRRWIWAVALLLLAAVALAAFLSSRSVLGESRLSVAVLGFKNLSGQVEADWISTALAEMLATELAAGEGLRLIPGENVARVKRELSFPEGETLAPDTLERLGANLGSDYVVVGSYLVRQQEVNPLLVLLQDTRGGETVVSVRKRGREEELYDLVAGAGADLRRALGVGSISATEQQAVRATLSASPRATRLYSEGLEALRSYDALTAREQLERAVEADPRFALAHAALSEAWRELGYDRRAEDGARRAFQLAEGLPREAYLIIQGRHHEAAGEWRQAVETYRVLWGYHPDNIDHGLRLVEVQTAGGRGAEALATLEALRELPPPSRDDPRIDLAEARVYWSLSDYQAMIPAVEQAAEKGRRRSAWLLVAEARAEQGRALIRFGRPGEAEEVLAEARSRFDAAGDRGGLAGVLNELAILRKYEGELDAAEELYREALAIERQIGHRKWVSRLLNNLAVLTRQKGDLTAAREMLRESMSVAREVGDPSREGVALENLSSVLLRQGELAEAERVARQALTLYEEIGEVSGAAWTWLDLGGISFAAGRLEEARSHLERSLELGGGIGYQHQVAYTQVELARVLLEAGEADEAARRLDEAERIRRQLGEELNLADVDLARAELLLARGRPDEAEELSRRAQAAYARAGMMDHGLAAAELLARALLARGELARAREVAETAREDSRQSESPAARLTLAVTAARLEAAGGSPREALARLEEAAGEAQRLGLVGLELAARLAAGEVELGLTPAAGRSRLQALAREARRLGLLALAGTAEALLASQPASVAPGVSSGSAGLAGASGFSGASGSSGSAGASGGEGRVDVQLSRAEPAAS